MWVKNYMFSDVCTTSPNTTVQEAIKKMVEKKTNSLVVIDDDNKPIGILSSHTVIREALPSYLEDSPVSANFGVEGTFNKYAVKVADKSVMEIMHTDFHILSEDDAMIEAAAYSVGTHRRILPVADDDGKLIGAVTRTCIKNALFDVLYPKK